MSRSIKSDIAALLQEARAIEMLTNETEVNPDRIQDYWALAADLLVLVTEIEEYQAQNPRANYDEPELLSLRRRLRAITSRLAMVAAE
jgi:hypothetical protein